LIDMTIRSSFVVSEIGRLNDGRKSKVYYNMLANSLCERFAVNKKDAWRAISDAQRMGMIELLKENKTDRLVVKVKYPPY